MKNLHDYTEEAKAILLEKYGAFRFNPFNENKNTFVKKAGIVYVDCGGYYIAPQENAKDFRAELNTVHQNAVQRDITENGKEAIIRRELCNYEAWYTGSIEDTFTALKGYCFTYPDVQEIYSNISSKRRLANRHIVAYKTLEKCYTVLIGLGCAINEGVIKSFKERSLYTFEDTCVMLDELGLLDYK